jgi:hypothetical protein
MLRNIPLLGRKQRCKVGARIALRDTEYHRRGGGVNATTAATSAVGTHLKPTHL